MAALGWETSSRIERALGVGADIRPRAATEGRPYSTFCVADELVMIELDQYNVFREAVRALDNGDIQRLETLLDQHPWLLLAQL